MADRSAKLRLGGFVAIALAAVAGLTVLFGGAPRLFTGGGRAKYTVTFAEAPGIDAGTPVRKSGVRIGEVTGLEIDEQTGTVRVSLSVDRKYVPREKEEVTIGRTLLNGDTSIDIQPKAGPDGLPVSVRGDAIPEGTEIPGITPINPSQLVRQASGVLPSAQESMARMLASVERFERAVPKIEKAFDEISGLARSGREFVPELRRTNEKVQTLLAFADDPADPDRGTTVKQTLEELREFLKTARPLVEDIRRIVRTNETDFNGTVKAVRNTADALNDLFNPANRKNIADLLKNLGDASGNLGRVLVLAASFLTEAERIGQQLNKQLAQLDPVLKSADDAFKAAASAAKNIDAATKPLGENAGPLLQNASVAADQLAKTLAEVRQTVQTLNRGDGTAARLLSDPALYNQLNESAVTLTRTLQRAERVAADLQVFADKIARRPESIGVGGAVRPNTGLKESPTAPLPGGPFPPTPLPPTPSYRPSDLPPR